MRLEKRTTNYYALVNRKLFDEAKLQVIVK